jgi:hypothetical protein
MVGLDEGLALNFGEKERKCLKALIDHGVRFLLVDGYAVRFHGRLRATKDVDVLVSNDCVNAERLCSALTSLTGPHPNLQPEKIEGRKCQINLTRYSYEFEILTAADGVPFDEAYDRRCEASYPGLCIPVISKDDLVAMKAAAARPQDIDDVEKLREAI